MTGTQIDLLADTIFIDLMDNTIECDQTLDGCWAVVQNLRVEGKKKILYKFAEGVEEEIVSNSFIHLCEGLRRRYGGVWRADGKTYKALPKWIKETLLVY